MWRFVVRRVLGSLLVVLAIPIVVFFLSRFTGDPVALMATSDMTDAQVAQLRTALGFNGSIQEQFMSFVAHAATGDFGVSIWQGQPALGLVLGRLPYTALLAVTSLSASILIGI